MVLNGTDLTSQLRLLHQQEIKSKPTIPSTTTTTTKAAENKTQQHQPQIFAGALRTLDDSVREACQDARKIIAVAVKSIEDYHSCFKKKNNKRFRATTHHPLSQDINLSIELTDGRLIAAASAAQQLAAAVAKTASTLNVRTDDFVQQKSPDRIDFYDFVVDHKDGNEEKRSNNKLKSLLSGIGKNSNTSSKDKNSFAIKHAAVVVQCLSQMASEARVCLAMVRDEAERVRVQRLKFAKCGVIVNPMDSLTTTTTSSSGSHRQSSSSSSNNRNSITTTAHDVLSQGSRLLEQTTEEAREKLLGGGSSFLKNLTTGTEEFLTRSGVSKASNDILSQVVKKAQDTTTGVASSSVFSTVGNYFDNVSKFASKTTDRFVDNVILGIDDKQENKQQHDDENCQSSTMRHRKGGGTDTIDEKQARELEEKRRKKAAELKMLAATSTRVDQRKVSEYAREMSAESKTLRSWKEMASVMSNSASNTNNDQDETGTNIEDRLGLRQEHEGLQHKFRDECAQSAKEVERSIQELGRMTTILQEQVSLQTEQLLVIEKNTDESVSNIGKAQEELEKHDLDKFWTFKRILAAIIWAHTVVLIVLHFVIR